MTDGNAFNKRTFRDSCPNTPPVSQPAKAMVLPLVWVGAGFGDFGFTKPFCVLTPGWENNSGARQSRGVFTRRGKGEFSLNSHLKHPYRNVGHNSSTISYCYDVVHANIQYVYADYIAYSISAHFDEI